jgi:hypothetical protein
LLALNSSVRSGSETLVDVKVAVHSPKFFSI